MAKRLRNQPYIEEMPDEILGDILGRLETKEAGRTCMVSRRWRNVWSVCRNLDLDFTNKKYNEQTVRKCVDYVLTKHLDQQRHEIDQMRIAFRCGKPLISDEDPDWTFEKWIDFANRKRVRNFDLDVTSSFCSRHSPSATAIADVMQPWERLTTLSLKSVMLTNSSVTQFLSNAPNLENLLLDNVPLVNLKVVNVPKMKLLEIRNCKSFVQIGVFSAPNLESFKYTPSLEDESLCLHGVYFANTPKLADIHLGGALCDNIFSRLASYVPHLQKLCLDLDFDCDCIECSNPPITIPTFGNLKELELRFTSTQKDDEYKGKIATAIEFIKACPYLDKVTLKYEIIQLEGADVYLGDADVFQGDVDVYLFTHECLKEVQVVGWSGLKYEVLFVRRLIHCAPIQVLKLDPTPPHQTEALWRRAYALVPKLKNEFEFADLAAQKLIRFLHEQASSCLEC